MKTSWDVTIWVGDDVSLTHTVTAGVHTITISGDETGRVALQFLDGFDGLVSFRDEISRVVADWVPPTPEEDLAIVEAPKPQTYCRGCGADYHKTHLDERGHCSICGGTFARRL
jgi:hypothetical protein